MLALILVGASVGLIEPALPWMSPSAIDLLLLLPAILSATLLRTSGAFWSAVWAALAFNFFFTEPSHMFTIYSPADVITFAVLALIASVGGAGAAKHKPTRV